MYEVFWFTGGVLTASAATLFVGCWMLTRAAKAFHRKNQQIDELAADIKLAEEAKWCAIQTLRDRDGRLSEDDEAATQRRRDRIARAQKKETPDMKLLESCRGCVDASGLGLLRTGSRGIITQEGPR